MVSSAGGILEQYEVKAVPEGKGSWSGVPLIHTPKKLAPNVQREELCLCLQRIAFQKQCLWFAVTSIYLLCPHMQKIIHPPTKVNICKYKYIYLWIEFYMPQLLRLVPTRMTTLLLVLLPPAFLSLPNVLLESSDRFSPPRVSDHKWRAASDGQVG